MPPAKPSNKDSELNTESVQLLQLFVRKHKPHILFLMINKSLFLDLASGSSIDWAYEKCDVPLTYTFEFRDRGRFGFLLPPNQIVPNSLEIIDGLYALVSKASEFRYF